MDWFLTSNHEFRSGQAFERCTWRSVFTTQPAILVQYSSLIDANESLKGQFSWTWETFRACWETLTSASCGELLAIPFISLKYSRAMFSVEIDRWCSGLGRKYILKHYLGGWSLPRTEAGLGSSPFWPRNSARVLVWGRLERVQRHWQLDLTTKGAMVKFIHLVLGWKYPLKKQVSNAIRDQHSELKYNIIN